MNQNGIINILKDVNAKNDIKIKYGEHSEKTIKKGELNFSGDEQWLIHMGAKVCFIKVDSIYEVSFNEGSHERLVGYIPNL